MHDLHPHRTQLESGLGVSYVEHGDPDGQTLVLLHGFTDSSFSFSRLLPLLDPDATTPSPSTSDEH